MRPYPNSRAQQRKSQPQAIAVSASRVHPLQSVTVQLALLGAVYALALWLL
jgi:hypothetical protein